MGKRLLVGLGNPGTKHASQRHNVGFMVLEELARRSGETFSRKRFNARVTTAQIANESVVMMLPQTYMNLSGRAVAPAIDFYDVDPSELVVVHDELDIPFGRVRVKSGGGHGGHNGLRSVFAELGTGDFLRVRVGIGRPPHGDAVGHVLSPFTGEESSGLSTVVGRAADAVELLLREGFTRSANELNGNPD